MTNINIKKAIVKAIRELKSGFNEGYSKEFDKVTKNKYEKEVDCVKKTKEALKDVLEDVTINEEKFLDKSYTVITVLGVLTVADIMKYGFKKHMKRAYTEPGKQYLLGVLIELIIILSSLEKDK